ncbi:MAG: MAP7 domain-containing protein, partial [Candidatus Hermodarchaeota archaeon]
MSFENINEELSEKERLEKERLEAEQFEKERMEKQRNENKLFPHDSLFMIPSWSDLLGYPTLGTYVHHPVSKIVSDPVIFLTGYDYSIETTKGTLHYLFGLGYYYLKFELESGKYITDNRILTGLILPDFVYDHMATSGNVTLEDDRDVIIAEKVIKVPVNLSYKSENHLSFIKGALMRNVFIPNKDIFLEMMERIRQDDSYQIAKDGHMLLSTHWDYYNQILVSEKIRQKSDKSYLSSTAGLDGIIIAADQHLRETISNINLSIIDGNIDYLKNIYSNVEFDPMYLFSLLKNASTMLNSDIPQISSSKRELTNSKTSKHSIFNSAEDRLYAYISWPSQFQRNAKKEPQVLPKAEYPAYLLEKDTQQTSISSVKTPDYKQENFELETLKSKRVESKILPNPPKPDVKQILVYLRQVINEDYEMRAIGQAFEIARESMRQISVSAATTEQKKIWEMSKYANIYSKKEPNLGLPLREKEELLRTVGKWIFDIEEEERKERERLEQIRLEKERRERMETERKIREQQEKERQERERLIRIRKEEERKRQEQLERAQLEKIEKEKQEQIRLERERIEKERRELEAIEKEKQELERLRQERKQKEKEAKLEAKKRKKLEKEKKK